MLLVLDILSCLHFDERVCCLKMSHYNFKKITVVPGGKVISLLLYCDLNGDSVRSAICT